MERRAIFIETFKKAKQFLFKLRKNTRKVRVQFHDSIKWVKLTLSMNDIHEFVDPDIVSKIYDYYLALLFQLKNRDYNTLPKNIFYASLHLVFQGETGNLFYFTIKIPLPKSLELDINYIKEEFNKHSEDYNSIMYSGPYTLVKMYLIVFIDPLNRNPVLLAFGPVKKTGKSVFSPVLYNWFCCITEVACFLKFRDLEFIKNKEYKYFKQHDWAYLNIWALYGDLFDNELKETFFSGDIKSFIMLWNKSVKYLDIVMYNSVTSQFFPIGPLPITNYILFWYPNHIEVLNQNQINNIKPINFKLKPNPKNKFKHNDIIICSLDIETYKGNEDGTQIPYLICIYSKDFQISFEQKENNNIIDEFIDFLQILKKNHKTYYYIWAHNGMKFDYLFLLPSIIKHFNLRVFGKLCDIKSINLGNIRFLDFFKFFPTSLNSLSKTFLNKSKLEFDFNLIFDKNSAIMNMETAVKYCMMDSQLLYEIIHLFDNMCYEKYQISINDCLSSSHLSKLIFQNKYLNVTLKGSILEDYDKELSSYHGGMCISFVKGFYNKPIYVYDINSSYPSCMRNFMPYEFIKEKEISKITKITDHYLYYVTFKFPEYNILCNLPTKVDGEMVFLQNGSGWYWGIELKTALKLDVKLCYEKVRKYKKYKLFENFVTDLYTKRKESKNDPVLYSLYKSILNSLYGKFGQKLRSVNYIERYDTFLENHLQINDITLLTDEIAYISYKDDYQYYNSIGSLVRLSSYITATGRSKILEPILDQSKKNLLYMDTDSLFLTSPLNDKWCDEVELGKFKCEIYKEGGIFISAKCYALLPDTKKMKGVNIKNVRIEHYFELLEHNKAVIDTTSSIKSMGNVKISTTSKVITDIYYKRRFINFYTHPLYDINDYLSYKKECCNKRILVHKTSPNKNRIISNLIKGAINNPMIIPTILPHNELYSSMDYSTYLKHRIIGYYPRLFTQNEELFVYNYIYGKDKIDIRDMLLNMYNYRDNNVNFIEIGKNKITTLQKNKMCIGWENRKLGELKKLFIDLQYDHILNKTI
jgi:hypothetical protein